MMAVKVVITTNAKQRMEYVMNVNQLQLVDLFKQVDDNIFDISRAFFSRIRYISFNNIAVIVVQIFVLNP